jgi:ABC-type microcin C transport system permease subunit YejE
MRIKKLTIWQNAGAGFPAKNRAAWPKPMPPADKNWLGSGLNARPHMMVTTTTPLTVTLIFSLDIVVQLHLLYIDYVTS